MTVLFLLPEVASGPIWHEKLDMAIANCHRSWWSVLLNVQNFYPYEQSVSPQGAQYRLPSNRSGIRHDPYQCVNIVAGRVYCQ